jgi:tellurite resistance protein TehA-like permease
MLGQAVLYAARRATSTAIDDVSRRAAWTATAGAFFLCALVSALIVAYWYIEPKTGPVNAVAIISAACLLVGLVCLSLPAAIERAERRRTVAERNAAPVATTVAAVDEEARQAVDYFGALQVVGAAFLFGLGAARKLKR